jgi:hypothetical protein
MSQSASGLSPVLSALAILRDFNTGRIKLALESLPEEIRQKKSLVTTARQALKDAEALRDEREAMIRFEISAETTDSGKSRFSNAEQRGAELTTRKGKDPEYMRLQGHVRNAQRELEDAETEHEALVRKFQAYGSVSDLVSSEIKLYAKLGVDGPKPGKPGGREQPF